MSLMPTFKTIEEKVAAAGADLENIFEMIGEPVEMIGAYRDGLTLPSVPLLGEIEEILGLSFNGPLVDSSAVLGKLKRDIMANGPFVDAWLFYEEVDGYLHFTDYAIAKPGEALSSLGRPENERALETDLGEVLRWMARQAFDPAEL